ncbi:MAG: Uma2 family endonuclease [Rhodopila sp.]
MDWEKEQPQRYEFDGTQPIPMTGGTIAHARLVRRLVAALSGCLAFGYEAFGGDLKVQTAPNRIRYPDALVVAGEPAPDADTVEPVVVVEILSPSTALTDRRVKPEEYATVASLLAYVILPQDGPVGATILRRSGQWTPEAVTDELALPEIGVTVALGDLYRG